MNIPDEAVEAAAGYLPHSGDCEVRPERDCTCWRLRMDLMREALDAAAPFIAAQALRETYDAMLKEQPVLAATWLRERSERATT